MGKKAKPKTNSSVRRPSYPRTRPRPAPLPGMEDHAIPDLEAVAREYADIRDSRTDLTKREADLKRDAVRLMHKHKKTSYVHDGITIALIAGDDDIRMKVKRPAPDDDVIIGGLEHYDAVRRAAVDAD